MSVSPAVVETGVDVVTWVSAVVFAGAMAGAWMWVGYQRRNAHTKKRRR